MKYDSIIIGAGPAGLTAAIYLARAGKSVLVLEKDICGGRITQSSDVRNIPGFAFISGDDFGTRLTEQAEASGAVIEYETVTKFEYNHNDNEYSVHTDAHTYNSKSLIIATGTKNRMLNIENEEKFVGNGIAVCATCDGPLYKNQEVIVIGGGNGALTEALHLSDICKSVLILQNLPNLTAEDKLISEVTNRKNITVFTGCNIIKFEPELNSDKKIGIVIEIHDNESILYADGIFISIGVIPQTSLLEKDFLDRNGYIITDTANSSYLQGLFACGDCVAGSIQQVSYACGSGTKAAINCINYLNK